MPNACNVSIPVQTRTRWFLGIALRLAVWSVSLANRSFLAKVGDLPWWPVEIMRLEVRDFQAEADAIMREAKMAEACRDN